MQGTYKLFAAAVLGLAMIFASMEVADRVGGDQPDAAPAEQKVAAQAPDAPQPVLAPAPNAAPELQETVVAQAQGEPKTDDAPEPLPAAAAPTVTGEGEAPAPMLILPASEN